MKSIVGLLKNFKVSDKTILRLYIVFSLMMGVLGLCIGFYLVTLFAINWVSSLLIVISLIAVFVIFNWLSKTNGIIAKLSELFSSVVYIMLSFFYGFCISRIYLTIWIVYSFIFFDFNTIGINYTVELL